MRDAVATTKFLEAMLRATGGAPATLEPGRFVRFSTNGKPRDQSGWAKVFDDGLGCVFGCYRQGITETCSLKDGWLMTHSERVAWQRQIEHARRQREEGQLEQWARCAQRNAHLWDQCGPLAHDDAASRYLKGRGLGGTSLLPSCLRLHRRLDYWHDGASIGAFPALIAPILTPDGRLAALHRTYLTQDGHKAQVPGAVKKLTSASASLVGASIPLFEPQDGVLGVAEGIETALAARCASGVPTVAAYSAGALASYQWPQQVRSLVIFADADKTGREAADTLRARALAAFLHVRVMTPSAEGLDWADVWASRRRTSPEGASSQFADLEAAISIEGEA